MFCGHVEGCERTGSCFNGENLPESVCVATSLPLSSSPLFASILTTIYVTTSSKIRHQTPCVIYSLLSRTEESKTSQD